METQNKQNKRFLICRTLDEPKIYILFTLDELIPILLSFVLGFLFNQLLIGIGIGAGIWLGLKRLKKGEGAWVLLAFLYWHLPHVLTSLWFTHFPPSHHRHYLA